MEWRRGQKVIFAPPGFVGFHGKPFAGIVGKVGDRFIRLKWRDDAIGEAKSERQMEQGVVCVDGGHNEMQSVLSALEEAYRQKEAEIKAARDKYDARIAELQKIHMVKK